MVICDTTEPKQVLHVTLLRSENQLFDGYSDLNHGAPIGRNGDYTSLMHFKETNALLLTTNVKQ